MSANALGWFSATVNGTGAGTGPDSVTQQEGVSGLSIIAYTDNGAGSYSLQFNKVISPSEYIVMLWLQTVNASGKTRITGTVSTDTLLVSTFAGAAGITATDGIFSALVMPIKG